MKKKITGLRQFAKITDKVNDSSFDINRKTKTPRGENGQVPANATHTVSRQQWEEESGMLPELCTSEMALVSEILSDRFRLGRKGCFALSRSSCIVYQLSCSCEVFKNLLGKHQARKL